MASIRESLRQRLDDSSALSVRRHVRGGFDQVRVSGGAGGFRVVAYNTAMLPLTFAKKPPRRFRSAPLPRKQAFRRVVTTALVREILRSGADVVGLCEAFGDDDRDQIASGVRGAFPFRHDGPDEPSLEEDGGLLLLSRTPFTKRRQSIFRTVAGDDGFSEKGILHVETQPSGSSVPVDFLFTHAQALELRFRRGTHESADPGRFIALSKQLAHIDLYRRAECDPDTPTVLFGDLNFPHTNPRIYGPFVAQLGGPRDVWLATHLGDEDGDTESPRNQFEDAPPLGQGSRLDYIFDYPGARSRLAPRSSRLLRWQHDGVDISDHFGLQADFEGTLHTRGAVTSRPVSRWSARILTAHCLEVSAPHNDPDDTRYRLAARPVGGSSKTVAYPVVRMSTGGSRVLDPRRSVSFTGDPRRGVELTVSASEVDSLSADDLIGTVKRVITRAELQHIRATNGVRDVVMPRQARDGEYIAVVRLRVS